MTRAAALAVVVAAACGGASPPPSIGNRGAVDTARWVGRYACQFTMGGWQYPLYECDIRSDHGRLTLEKVEGQMHLRGEVVPDADGGFAWQGEVTCDWAPGCTGRVAGRFVALPGGIGWEAHLPPHATVDGATLGPMVVTVYTEDHVAGQGGVRYGAYGQAGWNGGAYSGEVPVE